MAAGCDCEVSALTLSTERQTVGRTDRGYLSLAHASLPLQEMHKAVSTDTQTRRHTKLRYLECAPRIKHETSPELSSRSSTRRRKLCRSTEEAGREGNEKKSKETEKRAREEEKETRKREAHRSEARDREDWRRGLEADAR